MLHIHLQDRLPLSPIVVFFCCIAVLLFAAGCDQQSNSKTSSPEVVPLEFVQDISDLRHTMQSPTHQTMVSAQNLGFRGLGTQQRSLLDSLNLMVFDAMGGLLIDVTAEKAITLHPYQEINLNGVSIRLGDTTNLEGVELVWPYLGQNDRMALLGPTLLVTKDYMVECDTLIGDLFLSTYEILHVISVIDLRHAATDSANTSTGQ